MDPDMKEAAVLVLGVICDEDACLTYIEPYLASILPFLAGELTQQ